jgi:hypothetical protein
MVILSTMLALALSPAIPALAAAFPPKTVCLQMEFGDSASLAVKNVGAVKDAVKTIKMYQVSGVYQFYDSIYTFSFFTFPVTGTGYVNPDGKFHFTLTGAFTDTLLYNYALNLEGFINTSFTGTFDAIATSSEGSSDFWGSISPLECNSYVIEYGSRAAQGAPRGAVLDNLKARSRAGKARGQP